MILKIYNMEENKMLTESIIIIALVLLGIALLVSIAMLFYLQIVYSCIGRIRREKSSDC